VKVRDDELDPRLPRLVLTRWYRADQRPNEPTRRPEVLYCGLLAVRQREQNALEHPAMNAKQELTAHDRLGSGPDRRHVAVPPHHVSHRKGSPSIVVCPHLNYLDGGTRVASAVRIRLLGPPGTIA
jgi:hypothetical protein